MRTTSRISRWLAVALLLIVSPAGFAQATETVTYYYTDQQGTPLATADASGNILTTSDYRPYGSQVLGSPVGGPGYTGHVNDPDSGLVYMQARYYDPVVGRFLATDQVGPSPGNPLTFSRYAHAADNPVANVDADGRCVDGLTCDSMAKSIATHPDAFKALGPYAAGTAGIMALPTVVAAETIATAFVADSLIDASPSEVTVDLTANEVEEVAESSESAFPDRPLPRTESGEPVPEPDAEGPHTQLGQKTGRQGKYNQGREFDQDGKPKRDIDFTDHGRPNTHPHQHRYIPNPTGGTPGRGPTEPLPPDPSVPNF
jgi:RHS repeat-associated protein